MTSLTTTNSHINFQLQSLDEQLLDTSKSLDQAKKEIQSLNSDLDSLNTSLKCSEKNNNKLNEELKQAKENVLSSSSKAAQFNESNIRLETELGIVKVQLVWTYSSFVD